MASFIRKSTFTATTISLATKVTTGRSNSSSLLLLSPSLYLSSSITSLFPSYNNNHHFYYSTSPSPSPSQSQSQTPSSSNSTSATSDSIIKDNRDELIKTYYKKKNNEKKDKDKDDEKNKKDDDDDDDDQEPSIIDKLKKLSYELGQQTKHGIITYYNNWRYIQDVIKPKQNSGIALQRKDIIHLKTFKSDSLYWIPLGIYLIIPFSTFGLPLYIKYLSAILPSTFSTRQMIVKRNLSHQKHRRKLAKRLFKSLTDKYSKNSNTNTTTTAVAASAESISTTSQQQQQQPKQTTTTNEDERIIIRIQDLNRSHLVLLSRCIGIKWAFFMSSNQLQQKLRDWEKEVIQDNRLILREGIQKLSIEDLQDISYQRGILFKNKSYDQLLQILSKSLSISASPPSHSSYCFSVISSLISDDYAKDDKDNDDGEEDD